MSNLALTMRPTQLSEVLGNESAKRAIQSFIDRKNFPNVFLFAGPPGTGKTTLAEIVARAAGGDDSSIHEINASAENGVDSARELAEKAQSSPLNGQRRVFILNEFHMYTSAAQNVLKDPMEKTPALWLLTTDTPEKIEAAIKSRASAATFELRPLNDSDLCKLLTKIDPQLLKDSVGTFLWQKKITSPREILGVVDQYLSGVPLEQAVHGSEHEPLYAELGNTILSGNWTKTSAILKQIKSADFRAMIAVVSAKLRWALLESDFGPRGDALAACLVGLGNSNFADGVAYASATALFYKCTKVMGAT